MPRFRTEGSQAVLLVAETFGDKNPTFQGEGPSCGTSAVFIRLSRCNLACSWCDTNTWDWAHYDPRKESARVSITALSAPPSLVLITGGEPLLQQPHMALLVPGCWPGSKRAEIETNGTVPPDAAQLADGVTLNVSPKLANPDVPGIRCIAGGPLEKFAASRRAFFKFVVADAGDLEEFQNLPGGSDWTRCTSCRRPAPAIGCLKGPAFLAGLAAACGCHFSTPLQVQAFDGARGR